MGLPSVNVGWPARLVAVAHNLRPRPLGAAVSPSVESPASSSASAEFSGDGRIAPAIATPTEAALLIAIWLQNRPYD
jgi:hypothetical protein